VDFRPIGEGEDREELPRRTVLEARERVGGKCQVRVSRTDSCGVACGGKVGESLSC